MAYSLSDRTIDMEFIAKVMEISGQQIKKCMQCGTCAAVCPMDESTDHNPRRIIHMIQLGQKERVLDANIPWLCASCHVCEVRCPRGLDIPKIIEAVRLLTLRTNKDYVEPFEIAPEKLEELPQLAMVSAFRKHTA